MVCHLPFGVALYKNSDTGCHSKQKCDLPNGLLRIRAFVADNPVTVRHGMNTPTLYIGEQEFFLQQSMKDEKTTVTVCIVTPELRKRKLFWNRLNAREKEVILQKMRACDFEFYNVEQEHLKRMPIFIQFRMDGSAWLSMTVEGEPTYVDITACKSEASVVTVELPMDSSDTESEE